MTLRKIFPLVPLALASCASVRSTEATSAGADVSLATNYWFRGVPQSTKPVLQADTSLSMPLQEGSVDFTTWGNMQLSNDTGDGILPDGNGGEFDEIDLVASYSRTYGDYDISGGVISYNFPNVFAKSTTEAYVSVSRDAFELGHTASLYYDFDVADDFYLTYQISKSYPMQDGWSVDLSAMLGLMSDGQAELYFGTDDAGFSDLSGTVTASRQFDEATSIFFSLSGVVVPDSTLKDQLDDADLDSSGLWFTAGVNWSL